MTKGSRPDLWGASPVRAALTRKVTPLSLAIFKFLDSLLILFFPLLFYTPYGAPHLSVIRSNNERRN